MDNCEVVPLDFENENNSIFDLPLSNDGKTLPAQCLQGELLPQSGFFDNFIQGIKDKIDENKNKQMVKELEKSLDSFAENNAETLLILKSFGCRINVRTTNLVEISSDEFGLTGFIKCENGDAELDENCKKIFQIISTIISGGNRIEEVLNTYEEKEFYPIGEIVQETITYQGSEITVSKGMLANPQGEFKTIYFYRGYEIIPEDEIAESTESPKQQ